MSCRSAANSAKAFGIRKLGDIAAAGELGVGLDQVARQCRHVEALAQLLHHAPVGAEPNRLGELERECRIVLGRHADGVARSIGEARRVRGDLDVPGLARRAGAVEVDERSDLAFERVLGGERGLLVIKGLRTALEVDVHNRRRDADFGRSEFSQCALGPFGSLFGEVEVEVDAVGGARRAEGLEPRVDRPAHGAELRVRRVTQRQHRKAQRFVETRRGIAHEGGIEVDCTAGGSPSPQVETNTIRFFALARTLKSASAMS